MKKIIQLNNSERVQQRASEKVHHKFNELNMKTWMSSIEFNIPLLHAPAKSYTYVLTYVHVCYSQSIERINQVRIGFLCHKILKIDKKKVITNSNPLWFMDDLKTWAFKFCTITHLPVCPNFSFIFRQISHKHHDRDLKKKTIK